MKTYCAKSKSYRIIIKCPFKRQHHMDVLFGFLILSTFFITANSKNQVAVSTSSTCLLSAGNVSCWGYGDYGTLGTGNTNDLYEPPTSPINLGDDFIAQSIDCGENHCCSISTNKTLKCWGRNTYGQLGHGNTESRGDEPGEMGNNLSVIDLGSDFDADQVACGQGHTCVLSTNHEITCFGRGDVGQLGNGNTQNIGDEVGEMGTNLTVISLGTDFVPIYIDCGHQHSCALSANYQVICWGYNAFGQLGQSDYDNRGDNIGEMGDNISSIDLGSDFNVSSIQCGYWHNCALSNDYRVKCWGRNHLGNLGLGDTNARGDGTGEMGDDLPVLELGTDFNPRFFGAAGFSNYMVSVNGSMKAFGYGGYGQLGYEDLLSRGDSADEMGDFLPIIDLGDGFTVIDVASSCCSYHSCVLLENGTDFVGVKCFGRNNFGQLGVNDTEQRGDDENEMGDYLPFISIVTVTEDPTSAPSSEPTLEPTIVPTASPSIDPTIDPTATPIAILTLAPIAKGAPMTTPNTPTMEPTTQCDPHQNCTECLQMNSDEMTLCLWHSTNDECVSLLETGYIDEDMMFEQSSCYQVAESYEWISYDIVIVLIIAAGLLLFISCCILLSVILRKWQMSTNQGQHEREASMVSIDMSQSNIVPKMAPVPPVPDAGREPDLPDSPKMDGRRQGNHADDEGIEDMFTTTTVTTNGPGIQTVKNGNATKEIEGAR